MNEAELAAALKLQTDGGDVAAILLEYLSGAAEREGRSLEVNDLAEMIAPLLSATWQLAKLAGPDERTARALYTQMLRSHADAVERAG